MVYEPVNPNIHPWSYYVNPVVVSSNCWMFPVWSQAVLSEEELAGVEQVSATAAEVTSSMMRIKLELEEKKRTVNMLQTALVRERHTLQYRLIWGVWSH